MKINGWTEFICDSIDCVYNTSKRDCFYPGRVKLNQKCEYYRRKNGAIKHAIMANNNRSENRITYHYLDIRKFHLSCH